MQKVPPGIQTMSGLGGATSMPANMNGGEEPVILLSATSVMSAPHPLSRAHGRVLESKHRAPVAFHVDHGPAACVGFVERPVEFADVRGPVVGPFALGIGVVHEPHETRAATICGPLQHLLVAIGVAEGED